MKILARNGQPAWQAHNKNTQRQDQEYPAEFPVHSSTLCRKFLKYNLIAQVHIRSKSEFFEGVMLNNSMSGRRIDIFRTIW